MDDSIPELDQGNMNQSFRQDMNYGNNQNMGFEPSLRPTNDFRNSQPSFMNDTPNQDQNSQLILTKLDLINSRLQNIEQRLAAIEQIAKQSQEPADQRWNQRRIY